MDIAFKEWAAICEALALGRQSIILRKGGIIEPNGKFTLEHDCFLLLPTYLHQTAAGLSKEGQPLLRTALEKRPAEDVVQFQHWAKVSTALQVTSWDVLEQLSAFHCWSTEIVEERYNRWREKGVHLLVLRVFRLHERVTLPNRPEFGGCKSWAKLEEPIDVSGSTAVLGDAAHDEICKQILSCLQD